MSKAAGVLHADQNGVTAILGEVAREAELAWEELCAVEEVAIDPFLTTATLTIDREGLRPADRPALRTVRGPQESTEPGQSNWLALSAIAGRLACLRTR